MKPKDYKDAQTHYAKDDRGDSTGKFKEFIRDSKEKPHYLYNVVKGELENINDPKFGKKDTRDFNDKRGKRFINKTLTTVENPKNSKSVSFNPTTQLFTNEDRDIAFKRYDEADAWNKSLGISKPTEATPEQFGKLAENLERNRQKQGSSTDIEKFKNGYKEKPMSYREVSRKVFKDKRPFEKKTITEPVKIDLTPYKPFVPMDIPKRDPETLENERRFNQIVDESERAKFERNNSGLAGLIGGDRYGK